MDEDIIEGEVIDSYDPREDPRIAFEVEDFQQHMDEMKKAYLFAADMIGRGAFRAPPQPDEPQMPGKGRVAILMCGKLLIATGQWLVSKSSFSPENPPEEEQREDWAWSEQTSYRHPVVLPLPDIHRIRSL